MMFTRFDIVRLLLLTQVIAKRTNDMKQSEALVEAIDYLLKDSTENEDKDNNDDEGDSDYEDDEV